MLVYKCPKCGATYNKKDVPQNEMCFSCNTYLKVVNIREKTIPKKEENIVKQYEEVRQSMVGRVRQTPVIVKEEKYENVINEIQSPKKETGFEEKSNYSDTFSEAIDENVIEGTIISAVNDAGFRRLPWEKLCDKYFYSQKVSDIQNSIYVRCSDENGNISNRTIIMYGQMKGGIGVFRTGMKIRGEGKTNGRNEFVAKSLLLEDGVRISPRTEVADIIYFFSPLIAVFLCLLIVNFSGLMKNILSSETIKWYFFCIIGSFVAAYYIIGRVIRLPIVNRIHTCTWISIILGTIIFWIVRSIFII